MGGVSHALALRSEQSVPEQPRILPKSGGAPPKSLIIQFDTRGLEELYHPGVDLSHLHSLALFAFGSPSASLSDFGAVVGCCSCLKDLHISTYQRALPTELSSLLSNVRGSLRSLALVTFPHDFATFVAGGADTAFAEAAGLPQMRDIRQLNVTIVDFLGTGLPPQSFPLLTASCRARRIRLICRAQDPAGLA